MSKTNQFVDGKVLSGRVYPEFFPFAQSDNVLNVGCGYGPQVIAYQGNFRRMIGVDITIDRLEKSLDIQSDYAYYPIGGDVEYMPLASGQFDKAIAIDIIEHVRDPQQMCKEIHRLLKPGGEVLITFPTMHDRYVKGVSWVARHILRRKSKGTFHDTTDVWHPDAHNQEHPVREWIQLIESCGLYAQRSRATTLFPPLHLYGVPRFWFSNETVHRVDRFLADRGLLKNYGQGLMVIFKKKA